MCLSIPTPYKVAAVKIEFDGAAVPDYFGIDAVAISDSNYPIIADIPTMQLLASGIIIEALDKNVNSEFDELNPLLSPDGKTLYFTRKNHPQNTGGTKDKEDIWYSELDESGNWKLAQNMGLSSIMRGQTLSIRSSLLHRMDDLQLWC